MKNKNGLLLLLILVSSILLISINFYTIKILSGVRSYIKGESAYSKGQKEASLFLIEYIHLEDEQYWQLFQNAIAIPGGDAVAKRGLTTNGPDDIIIKGFMEGKNDPADIPDMIWLFRVFGSTAFMKEAVDIWTAGDELIGEIYLVGLKIHDSVRSGHFAPASKEEATMALNILSQQLSAKESAFSMVLGRKAAGIDRYLLLANIMCIVVIVSCIAFYVMAMLNNVNRSKRVLEAKNMELYNAGRELDTFVYSLSHDLRSPITSIKGLLYIAKGERNADVLSDHMVTIGDVIDKQDAFIKEIIDFFRNKRASVVLKQFSMGRLVDDVINTNRYIPGVEAIKIGTDIALDIMVSDELRMKMILNNLVSNAIKYSDDNKADKRIDIRTSKIGSCVQLEVEDNGIGIEKEYFDKIFQMFFVTPNNNRGTGLGLYILQQNVEKLDGTVHVESKVKVGTKFTVRLPCN